MPEDEQLEPPPNLSLDDRDELLRPGWPAVAFIERRLADDPTNWWVPNPAAVEAMVRSTGLRVVTRPGHEIWICERERAGEHGAELDAATGRSTR
jgi:tRNA (mo5U34)-methyltransferase